MGSQQQSAMVRSLLAGTLLFLLASLFFSNFVWLFGPEASLTRMVLGFAITTSCLVVGFTLALVLFLNVDDDMKSIKTLVVGALSGTTLIKAESILEVLKYRYHQAFTQGEGSSLSLVFFLGFSTALLGFVSGFFWVRLGGLAKEVARANSEVQTILAKVPLVPTLPWPEFREEFISAPEKLPDEKELNRLANIGDWSSVPPSEMIRAGAALLAKKRPEEALKPLRYALAHVEPPSPMAFDLYAAALVDSHARAWLPEDKVREFEREIARMLTYWPGSFLVNLDAGYLYLYARGKAELAAFYSRRALEQRPQSGSANYNLACALAQSYGTTPPNDEQVKQLVSYLEKYLVREPSQVAQLSLQEDFQYVRQNQTFAAWLDSRSVSVSTTSSVGITEEAA